LLASLFVGPTAAGAPTTIRIATLAPDGSAWARELKAWAREVQNYDVAVRLYFGGIAGDENEMISRVRRGQLDGFAGTTACYELAPTLRASRVLGLFASNEQAERLVRMLPHTDDEYRSQGFVNLGFAGIGPSIIFSKIPVRSWSELTKLRLWRWDADPVGWQHARLTGFNVVPLPLEKAMSAFDDGRVDGFIGVAASSLAFQWHARAPYVIPLEVDHFFACLLISTRRFDELSIPAREALRSAAAKLERRLEYVGAQLDHAVMSGSLVGRIQVLLVSDEMRRTFRELARSTRPKLVGAGLLKPELLEWLEAKVAADSH
jgi:TRAP-type C4-dicarboxylate transport system substrate-binding protein